MDIPNLTQSPIPLQPQGKQYVKLEQTTVRKLHEPPENDRAAALRKAAEDFEAVFLFQMMKQMRSGMQKEDMFHGGMGEDVFTEMLDEEFSKKMAGRGSAGIADMLYAQLSRQFGIGETQSEPALPLPSENAQAIQEKLRTAQSQAHTQNPQHMATDL